MKKLVLIFCYVELVFTTVRSFNEKISPYPKFLHMQRPKTNNLITLQQAGQNEKIKRILHLMHLANPHCLRKFHNELCYNRRPLEMLRPLRVPAFRSEGIDRLDQVSLHKRMRQNQLKQPQNRRYFVNDRIIYAPPYAKLGEKWRNEFQNKNTLSESFPNFSTGRPKITKEMQEEISVSDIFRPNEENRKYAQTYQKFKDQFMRGHSTALQDIQKAICPRKGHPSRFPQRVNNASSSTATYSDIPSRYFWPQAWPTKIQPYEVEEIIEEEVSVNIYEEKNEPFKNLQFGRPSLPSRTKDLKQKTNSEGSQKMHDFHDVIDSSINTVLKTLMAPVAKPVPSSENNRVLFSKERFWNRPPHSDHFLALPSQNETFSYHNFSNNHGTVSDKRPPNRPEKSKELKITSTPIDERSFNWEQKSSESTSAPDVKYDSSLNLKPLWTVEHQNNDDTDTTTQTPSSVLGEKSIPYLIENLRQNKTTEIETENLSTSSKPELNNHSLLTTVETQKPSLNSLTSQQISVKPTKYPDSKSEFPSTLIKVSPGVNELTTVTSMTANPSEDIKTFIPTQSLKTKEPSPFITLNEEELTTRNFQEFTDHPLNFNLLTTTKSDLKKNSRKMHFGQKSSETTSNHIAEDESTGPRRSDILITKNFEDYAEVDNNLSTLNYLDKLKQSNSFPFVNFSLDSSSESVIPLIPAVITDLQEGKISPEDISVLSEAFSKYWPAITALSNITNLDMLPLLKMKTEEDLKKILEMFFLENTEVTTIKTTGTESIGEGNEYDYNDEYDGFYQYVLALEQQEKERKQEKLRPKRNDEDDSKKVTQSHSEIF